MDIRRMHFIALLIAILVSPTLRAATWEAYGFVELLSVDYSGVLVPSTIPDTGTYQVTASNLHSLAPFNPSLGTVTNVNTILSIDSELSWTSTWQNNDNSSDEETAADVFAQITTSYGINGLAAGAIGPCSVIYPLSTFTCGSVDEDQDVHFHNGGLGLDEVSFAVIFSTSIPENICEFNDCSLSGFGMTFNSSLSIIREYTYVPAVPIPPAYWMFSAALTFLGCMKRRISRVY